MEQNQIDLFMYWHGWYYYIPPNSLFIFSQSILYSPFPSTSPYMLLLLRVVTFAPFSSHRNIPPGWCHYYQTVYSHLYIINNEICVFHSSLTYSVAYRLSFWLCYYNISNFLIFHSTFPPPLVSLFQWVVLAFI